MKNRNHLLEGATLRVLNQNGKTVGAGFLISESLAVTCAHVVRDAGGQKGGELDVEFYQDRKKVAVRVSDELWSDPSEDDVACLILGEKHGKELIPLARETNTLGHDFVALGFPSIRKRQSHYAEGKLTGENQILAQTQPLLQLSGKDIYRGMSGSAVLDLATNMIVGMISEYIPVDTEKYGYATTSRVIRSICRISEGTGIVPNISMYVGALEIHLEEVVGAYKNWGYDTQSMMRMDQLGKQTEATLDAIHSELQKYPDYHSRLTLEGLLLKIKDDFSKLKGVLFLTVLNSTNEERVELEMQKNLTAYADSIKKLMELSR